jgi:hypothetical protein
MRFEPLSSGIQIRAAVVPNNLLGKFYMKAGKLKLLKCSENYTHKHTRRCASNPNKENPQNGVWIKRRQPPSKILKTILTEF